MRVVMSDTPSRPRPSTVTADSPEIDAMAFATLPSADSGPMRVPGTSGRKVFLIQIGMSLSTAGCIVLG